MTVKMEMIFHTDRCLCFHVLSQIGIIFSVMLLDEC